MASTHLTDAELQKFRSKMLSARELGLASRHMSTCDACARRLRDSWQAPAAPRMAAEVHHLTYEDMSAVLDESAAVSVRDWVEEHSRVCTPCSRQLSELRDLDALMSRAEEPVLKPVPLEGAAVEAPRWGFWAWVNGSLAAALAVVLVVLATVSRVRDDASAAASTHRGSNLPLDKPLVAIGLVIGVGLVFLLLLTISRRRSRKDQKTRRKP